MNNPTPVRPRRKAINVSLDPELVEEARALGINVSRACESGLQQETKAARDQAFRQEIASTVAYWNEYGEQHGLPLAKYRMF